MDASRLIAILEDFSSARVLCVGDSMLDHFVHGEVERISPEAPTPVFAIRSESLTPGGAANVLRNLISLGGTAHFLTVVGDDESGHRLTAMIGGEPRTEASVLVEHSRPTTVKTRYLSSGQQLFRADREIVTPIGKAIEERLLSLALAALPGMQAVLLSDYGKGVLTESLLREIIAAARAQEIPVIIDPKARDFSRYRGAALLSPNLKELEAAVNRRCNDDAAIIAAAEELMKAHRLGHMLVTRGAAGMTLVSGGKKTEAHHIRAVAREVYDVTGAGDSVIATLATAIAASVPLHEAALLANAAGGIAVGRSGTTAVHRTELKTALYTQYGEQGRLKVQPLDIAAATVETWRREGKKIGFTNGCFDLIHPGHLSLLQQARAACDRLIVGLNSDASVRRLKGPSRPVNDEISRAMVLAALSGVDSVVIFREDTPMALLEKLRPDVLIKGADYRMDEVVGAEFVQSYGGEVMLAKLVENHSTSRTITRIAAQALPSGRA